MGSVIGKIDVEVPKHRVIEKGENYEIREYPECLAAEVTYDPTTLKQGRDGGFMILAGYIGAVGKPNNTKVSDQGVVEGEKIAMTAPVITQETQGEPEKIAMTAPVITQETQAGEADQQKKLVTMQFLLPAQYRMDNVPKPTDDRVSVKEVPARKYGVLTFSGVADDTLSQQMLGKLTSALQEKGYKITGPHILARDQIHEETHT
ncbi:hypothetical protein AXG93_4295s1700 [Marchantia polymorpha subsp. ruderalis]|uniref:SOUL heme-binding protein n=1 Tax=Marchantia polymorpha subsp. ruderalis TaxID=1480154 RepID=A0A176WBA9_MARPO|nr:hypothetical protein AXG93_4295s1700 [Marchantia polymorpha subsp. ruderalis]